MNRILIVSLIIILASICFFGIIIRTYTYYEKDSGLTFFDGIIWLHPLHLDVLINIDELEKINFNKIILHNKNKSIDILSEVNLSRHFIESEILLFKNYGIMDFTNWKNDRLPSPIVMSFGNVVKYHNYKNIAIEIDITIVKKNTAIEHEIIVIEGIRKRGWYVPWG